VLSGVAVAPTPAGAERSGAAQAAEPTITVDPADDLVDGARVTVTVAGLDPDTWVNAAQCTADAQTLYDGCDPFDTVYGIADEAGIATLSVRVDAILTTVDEEALQQTDCREHACVVGISTEDEESLAATASLHFLSDGPLAPPPLLTVTPDDHLTDLQTVTVNGSGLVWRNYGQLVQCAADVSDASECDFQTLVDFETAEDGSFEVAYQVSTLIEAGGNGIVDCRIPDSCVLVTTQDYSLTPERSAVAALAFDADAQPTVPTLTVTPDVDLVDGQTVSVTGSGFRPNYWVDFMLCGSEPSYESCQWLNGFAETGPDGTFTTDLPVFALKTTDGGDVDCRSSADPCVLVATSGSPTSPRAGRAPLHFAPDAPLLPPPTITVEPSTGLPDAANVTVTGSGFTPHGYAYVNVCAAGGGFDSCDPQAEVFATPDANGAFTVDLGVASSFENWEGEPIDCLAAPGCEVRAEDGVRRRRATVPLAFAPPVDNDRRYLDPVFDEVEITRDLVYRETVDAYGDPVQLTLDVYEPAGDTADMRPAVVWMHDGWFTGSDDGEGDMARYAEAFARRGYVAVTVDYRSRPDLDCCPTDDAMAVTDAILDGHDDAAAAMEWLHEHADEYRIDHEAVAVGGAAAGATNSFGLAYPPDDMGGHDPPPHHMGATATATAAAAAAADPMDPIDHEPSDMVAAALPISGVSFGSGAAGGPPVLAFNGDDATTAPLHLSEWTCARAEKAGSHCEVVAYAGAGDEIATTRQRDIVRRSADFLADMVLEPLGYLDPVEEPPTTTPTTGSTTGSTAPTSPPTAAVTPQAGGSLPRTGSDATMTLVRVGLTLAGLGTVLLLVARRRRLLRLRADSGHAGARTAALLAIAVFAALVIPRAASGQEADDPPADDHTEDTVPETTAPPDPGEPNPTVPGTTVPGEPATTVPADTVPDDATPTTMTPEDPAPADMADPGHEEPEDPGHGDPSHEFPDEWTDEQVAFAETLIADTEVALERYRNPAILPLLGYVWIHDGTELGRYQHWINTGWIADPHTLEPEHPESLVFRNTEDGPVLEAAMYMLGLGYTMANIPEDIAWLPGWHVHENLCFDGLRLVGIAVDGVCERGAILIPPPMVHVWIVDTPCGRFPGVDEHGLMCDHEEH
jgi:acetyl esterase/lipase